MESSNPSARARRGWKAQIQARALDKGGKLKPARAQRGVEPTAEVQGGAREGDVTKAAPCRRLVGVQAGR